MKRCLASLTCSLLLSGFSLCQISGSMSTGPNGAHGTMRFYSARLSQDFPNASLFTTYGIFVISLP